MNQNKDYRIPVLDYVDGSVLTKVVKLIQSYTKIIDKVVWKK